MNLPAIIANRPRSFWAYAALLGASVIWGVNVHVVKLATTEFSILTYLALRFWIAAIYYVAFAAVTRRPLHPPKGAGIGSFYLSAVVIALLLGAFYGLQTASIHLDNAVNAIFLTATAVVWVPLYQKLVGGRSHHISRDAWLGIFLALVGVLFLEGFHFSKLRPSDVLGLGGAFALAAEILVIGKFTANLKRSERDVLLPWTFLYTVLAAIFFTVVAVWTGAPLPSASATGWLSVLFVGLVATGLANLMANWAQAQKNERGQIINATHRALIENLDAPIAGICEILATTRGLGCMLILAGVLVAELTLWSRLRSAPKAKERLS